MPLISTDTFVCGWERCEFGGEIDPRKSTAYAQEWIDGKPVWFHSICLREFKNQELLKAIWERRK